MVGGCRTTFGFFVRPTPAPGTIIDHSIGAKTLSLLHEAGTRIQEQSMREGDVVAGAKGAREHDLEKENGGF